MGNKYLARYAEAEARALARLTPHRTYQYVLVIPAYSEPASLGERLHTLAGQVHSLLIILVLNQPDNDPAIDANLDLRSWLQKQSLTDNYPAANSRLLSLPGNSALLWVERPAPMPRRQGVGLARKLGCDLAAAWIDADHITSNWIHCSDADAHLDAGRFHSAENITNQRSRTATAAAGRPAPAMAAAGSPAAGSPAAGSPAAGSPAAGSPAAAIAWPFRHVGTSIVATPSADSTDLAMQLYELRLHYYVLGLRMAGSPYAFHTLGSCLSVDASAYAKVRGFPRRAAAEDFYLLNKIAKTGPVATPRTPLTPLENRTSQRVPFGTGPAVAALAATQPLAAKLFYHPTSFHALHCILELLPSLFHSARPLDQLVAGLSQFDYAATVIGEMGIEHALLHAQRHSKDSTAFQRHFHQWFDGFRTLKFVHGMRAHGWADLDFAQSYKQENGIWPGSPTAATPAASLLACLKTLGWLE